MIGDPFGWGGLHLVPPAPRETAKPAPRELTRETDAAEAERFRLECERDLRGEDE